MQTDFGCHEKKITSMSLSLLLRLNFEGLSAATQLAVNDLAIVHIDVKNCVDVNTFSLLT